MVALKLAQPTDDAGCNFRKQIQGRVWMKEK